jgi:hypothetical protein
MNINLVNENDHMDERFHLDDIENKNAVCIMDANIKHE